ncbi:hypothetical protein VTL71DRAFT_9875 [Oculimacula yallundae]|uniref:Uncharacterized protein n=1 Tax=Oculimacula yallundae TaxID=86028 RepID=A0ABR4BTQ9_9HELO
MLPVFNIFVYIPCEGKCVTTPEELSVSFTRLSTGLLVSSARGVLSRVPYDRGFADPFRSGGSNPSSLFTSQVRAANARLELDFKATGRSRP